ncbi:XRE family transcriptional regulator [Lactiplantibacillus garii]|uniref:XRE family transcriptional regulator n=1 Tax=Lactiplantibacillus garii TaxID=2306423 RepID=A0A3R8J6N3_9LACO|nr:helix-turn-helix transcriptional regulator [Lactiplantibacillus garii]RRK10311.1 XRE family transcriptional regulator [Lactiplantibacillus garii]
MQNSVGGNIASERRAQNMTQEQLAEFSDLTINYLSKIERGISKQLSANTLYKISKALGVSMDSLMTSEKSRVIQPMAPNQKQLNHYLNTLDIATREQLSKALLEVLKVSNKGQQALK